MNRIGVYQGNATTGSTLRQGTGSLGVNLPATSNIPGPAGFVYGQPDLSIRPYGAASTVNVTPKALHPTQMADGVWRARTLFARALPQGIVGTPMSLFAGYVPSGRNDTLKG